MMKNITLILLVFTTLITGCDRDTLKGLNLKIDAEVKSDYDEELPTENSQIKIDQKSQIETSETSTIADKQESSTPSKSNQNRKEEDPDKPMAFREITDCSESGIRAKTNEIFYANNPQTKSIDSKDEKAVKKWKKIYQNVESKCN